MELSIASPRLFKEKSDIKREKADDDGDDRQPYLQLFGEKVVRYSRDHHEVINNNRGHDDHNNGSSSSSTLKAAGKVQPTNLRLRESLVLAPAADDDDHNDDAGGGKDGEMRVVSGYRKGLAHFRQLAGGGGAGIQQHRQRHSSLLERQILPGISSNSGNDDGGRRSAGSGAPKQLTMFYAGMVNVFDNIPAEKVEAIVLLARESCASKAGGVPPKLDITMKMPHSSNPPPPPCRPKFAGGSCKLQADQLPVARKISLQHFMEKRRLRITSKSPYFSSLTEQSQNSLRRNIGDQDEEEHRSSDDDVGSHDDHHKLSLSPFPSRSRYFLSSSTNMKTGHID